jgi:ketosteroid isomerase-like protein
MQKNGTKQLEQLVEQWIAALLKGDADVLDHMTADDFITIGPRGFVLRKDQWLAGFKSGGLKYETLEWDETSVHSFGDTTLITGHDKQKVTA